MPIYYKPSFVVPLLSDMNRKAMNSPEVLAKTFTDAYVRAVLQGLPAGTPSALPATLPAPGLNPSGPPPPYPILPTAVPVNNYSGRQRRMQQIMYIYFLQRQLRTQNGSIKGVVNNIKTVLRTIKATKAEIRKLQKQLKFIQQEIIKLPKLLEDLKFVIEDIVKEEAKYISRLAQGLSKFKFKFTPEEAGIFNLFDTFTSLFVSEENGETKKTGFKAILGKLNQIAQITETVEKFLANIPTNDNTSPNTNFGPVGPQEYFDENTYNATIAAQNQAVYGPVGPQPEVEEPGFNFAEAGQASGIPRETTSQPNIQPPSPQQPTNLTGIRPVEVTAEDPTKKELAKIKKYFLRQILESFRNVFSVVNTVASPLEYIGYITDVANYDAKYKRVQNVLEKYRLVYLFLKPQLKKLKLKLDTKVAELKKLAVAKLNGLKDDLKGLIKKKTTRKTSPEKIEARKQKLDWIKEKKKKFVDRLKVIRFITKDTIKILKLANTINQRRKNIQLAIEYEVETGWDEMVKRLEAVDTLTRVSVDVQNGKLGLTEESVYGVSQGLNVPKFVSGKGAGMGPVLVPVAGSDKLVSIDPSLYTPPVQDSINDFNYVTGNDRPTDANDFIRKILIDLKILSENDPFGNIIYAILKRNIKPITLNNPYVYYRFFLSESKRWTPLYANTVELIKEAEELYVRAKALLENVSPMVEAKNYNSLDSRKNAQKLNSIRNRNLTRELKTEFNNRFYGTPDGQYKGTALGRLLKTINSYLKGLISRIAKKVREVVETYIAKLKQWTRRQLETIERVLLGLVPVRHEVKDNLTKAELIRFKKARIKQRAKQIKRAVKSTRLILKAFTALREFLLVNIVQNKKYRYSENAEVINRLIDSFFDYKIYRLDSSGTELQFTKDTNIGTINNNESEFLSEFDYKKAAKNHIDAQKQRYEQQRQNTKVDISALLSYLELFYDTFIEIRNEINTFRTSDGRSFGEVLKDKLKQYKETLVTRAESSTTVNNYVNSVRSIADDFEQLWSALSATKNIKVSTAFDIIANFENRLNLLTSNSIGFITSNIATGVPELANRMQSGESGIKASNILDFSPIKTAIINTENEIIGNVKDKYNAFANSQLAQQARVLGQPVNTPRFESAVNEPSKRSKYYRTIGKFVPKKPFNESLILLMLGGLKKVFQQLGVWIQDFYKKYIEPQIQSVVEYFTKLVNKINEQLEASAKKAADKDMATTLPKFLDLATKAFWTGFSWFSPDGSKYTVTVVPPITSPLLGAKGKPPTQEDGLNGWVDATGYNLFQRQLRTLQGILQPPPNTGIPPVPWVGYF